MNEQESVIQQLKAEMVQINNVIVFMRDYVKKDLDENEQKAYDEAVKYLTNTYAFLDSTIEEFVNQFTKTAKIEPLNLPKLNSLRINDRPTIEGKL